MLICPSFTSRHYFFKLIRSSPDLHLWSIVQLKFLHPRILITQQEMASRPNKAVGGCALSSMHAKCCSLHRPNQSLSMLSLWGHHFCEAVSNLLTVAMHFQDTLPRFHCPSLHEVDFRVHVTCTVVTKSVTLFIPGT